MGYRPTYKEDSLAVLLGTVAYGQITSGSNDLHSCTFNTLPGHAGPEPFTSADVGRIVLVLGAGVSGANLIAKVLTYVGPSEVLLTTTAGTTAIPGTANVIIFRPAKVKEGTITYDESITASGDTSFTIQISSPTNAPVEGQPFLVTSADSALGTDTYGAFVGGELDTVKTPNTPGQSGYYESDCKCVTYQAIAARRAIRGKAYTGQTLQQIATDILSRGLTAEFVDLSCPMGPTLPNFTVDELSFVQDALNNLTQQASDNTTGYYWKATPYRKYVIEAALTVNAPWHASDADATDSNIMVLVSNTRSREKLANQIYLKNSQTLTDPPTTFTFKNPAHAPFGGVLLPSIPAFAPAVTINSTPITVATIDSENLSSWQTANQTVPNLWAWVSGTASIVSTAVSGIPVGGTLVAVFRTTYDSLSLRSFDDGPGGLGIEGRAAIQGGSGLHESVVSVDVPMLQAEMDEQSATLARRMGIAPSAIDFYTIRSGLRVGQAFFIRLADVGVALTYLVASVKLSIDGGLIRFEVQVVYGSTMGDWRTALVSAFSGNLPVAVGGVPGGSNPPAPDLALYFSGTGGMVGTAYAASLIARGGNPGYTYAIAVGSTLPPGLSLDTGTGAITGTPTIDGSFTFLAQVTDSALQVAYVSCSVNITAADISSARIVSLVATEVPNGVYQDTNGGLHLQVILDIGTASPAFPVPIRIWIDFDDGRGDILFADDFVDGSSNTKLLGGQDQVTGVTIPGSLWVPTDPTTIHWRFKVEANAKGASPSTFSLEYDLDVTAAQATPATDITDIHFVPDPDTGDVISYALSDQQWFYIWHEIDFTQPCTDPSVGAAVSDAYFKSSFLTKQLGYGARCIATVSGTVNITLTSGTVLDSDVTGEVHISGQRRKIVSRSDSTHFVIDSAVSNGAGQNCEIWRPAPADLFGTEGADAPDALEVGYRGLKFSDGTAASKLGQTVVQLVGLPEWNIPPTKLPDGTTNLYVEMRIRVYAVSRLADNEAGGAETITQQTGWPANWDGSTDYGSIFPVPQQPSLDLSRASRPNSFAGPSVITGGDGTKLDVGVSGALTKIANEIVVANQGITNTYIGSQAADSRVMAANAITYANSALAALAVVDANMYSVALNKVTYGTTVFAGPVVLSRGPGNPVISMDNAGIFLYGTGTSSGSAGSPGSSAPSYTASGLTSTPYVGIQSNQIGVFSSLTGPSVVISAAGIDLWSVNGSTGAPYGILTSSQLLFANGNFSLALGASQIKMSYLPGGSLLLDTTGITLTNGSASAKLTPLQLLLSLGSSSVSLGASSGLTLTGGLSQATLSSTALSLIFPSLSVVMGTSGGAPVINMHCGIAAAIDMDDGVGVFINYGANGMSVTPSVASLAFGSGQVYIDNAQIYLTFGSAGVQNEVKVNALGTYITGGGAATPQHKFEGYIFTSTEIHTSALVVKDAGITYAVGLTSATATTGAATLPAHPVGFLIDRLDNGSFIKVPYYNA